MGNNNTIPKDLIASNRTFQDFQLTMFHSHKRSLLIFLLPGCPSSWQSF